jgi:hypothetical protein
MRCKDRLVGAILAAALDLLAGHLLLGKVLRGSSALVEIGVGIYTCASLWGTYFMAIVFMHV